MVPSMLRQMPGLLLPKTTLAPWKLVCFQKQTLPAGQKSSACAVPVVANTAATDSAAAARKLTFSLLRLLDSVSGCSSPFEL